MKHEISIGRPAADYSIDIDAICSLIAKTQLKTGEIPWSDGQKTDPWDHIEAAMALSTGGYLTQAQRAFEWSVRMQHEDGSWYSAYMQGLPQDKTRDANLSSYIAVGVFHYYLTTTDLSFVKQMWPTVAAAIDFALGLQTANGEIHWAISPAGNVDPMALLTGSSSIYMSLKCALALANILGRPAAGWHNALIKLGDAIRYRPHLFNMTKSRYSMYWFYPILAGVLTGAEAQKRIDKYWKKYVIEERGVLCVSDEPWVTIAETSELVMALAAMGNFKLAEIVFSWIADRKYEDGSFWCGFTCPDIIIWPEDKITWTNAAAILAFDAINNLTPGGRLFSHEFWKNFGIKLS
ncbi:MAG: phenyltransferase domain-containing protein [Desulfobacterales bacterium]|nr:MAG: phenyltransferase domain-containing protein [Desulfobacterales bacterium]